MFAVIVILLFSACIDMCTTFGFCKKDVEVETHEEQLGPRDVIAIKEVRLLPNPPLVTGQNVLLTIVLVNTDINPLRLARNVIVELSDAPTFKSPIGKCNPTPEKNCPASECRKEAPCTLMPKEEKEIYFNLLTPTKDEIGNIITKPTLKFHVLYDFTSNTKFNVVVINPLEIIRKEKENEILKVTRAITYSSGPIRVDMDIKGQEYVLGGRDATIVVTLKDEGSGNVVDNVIPTKKMHISFPKTLVASKENIEVPELEIVTAHYAYKTYSNVDCTAFDKEECKKHIDCFWGRIENREGCFNCKPDTSCSSITDRDSCNVACGGRCEWRGNVCTQKQELLGQRRTVRKMKAFSCSEKGKTIECENVVPIEIFRDESLPLLFKIKNVPGIEISKTYTITANVTYTYEIKKSMEVEIRPE